MLRAGWCEVPRQTANVLTQLRGTAENRSEPLRLLLPAQPHGRAQGHPLPRHQTLPPALVWWGFMSLRPSFLAKLSRNYQIPPKVVENGHVSCCSTAGKQPERLPETHQYVPCGSLRCVELHNKYFAIAVASLWG